MLKNPKFYIFFIAVFVLVSIAKAEAATLGVKNKQGTPISEVVVILKPIGVALPMVTDKQKRVDVLQRNLMFEPRISLVQTGGKVSFPNFDDTQHHVYSFSKAKKFEFPLYHGQSPEIVLDQEGIISVGCNIHDWMLAYIVVSDSPYFGLSNKKGWVNIPNVADGQYNVLYWSVDMDPEKGLQTAQTITISGNSKQWLTFSGLDAKTSKSWPKEPSYDVDMSERY